MPSAPEIPVLHAGGVPADAIAIRDVDGFPVVDVEHPRCRIRVRSWREDDADALASAANDPDVPRYLRDRFPHPYTRADAEEFLRHLALPAPALFSAIEVDGRISGGIGFNPGCDVERHSAELGYWLAPACWGRGIMTATVAAYVPTLFDRFALQRVWSKVYAPNVASMRVLERCGFAREGVLRNAILKHGELLDAVLYARIAGDRA